MTAEKPHPTIPGAMAACALCQRSVVAHPDTLSDGRLVHAACKAQLTRVPRRRASSVKGDAASAEDGRGTPPESKRAANAGGR